MKRKFGYVDGYVLPVPRKNIAKYKKLAQLAGKVWREHGAIDYVECVADGVRRGKLTSFPRSVKLRRGEVVILAWATYRSRSHRDRVMAKVFADKRLEAFGLETMPFDAMRMFWGGFKPIVRL